ncbi:hypothetical protein RRG08_038465 [Elysia crispata]|uniref:Uncharacterized protein n=1 Tax=Elysia crispata TaxID=231223 RepID=A0AAE0YXH0_9GAST|nr:hypothetical protein RRG08_038465 [Elysia crispata]
MPGGQPAPTTAKGDKVVIYAPIDVAVDKFYGNRRVGETDSSGRMERAKSGFAGEVRFCWRSLSAGHLPATSNA